ncbi:MAG: hypothetical protein FJ128_00615 [Deltaproteobacteria bacterium]|nr:hypothetical protein [Deltaproteobacteria bacterium]
MTMVIALFCLLFLNSLIQAQSNNNMEAKEIWNAIELFHKNRKSPSDEIAWLKKHCTLIWTHKYNDYARVYSQMKKEYQNMAEGAIYILKKSRGNWHVLEYGGALTDEEFRERVPQLFEKKFEVNIQLVIP